MGTSCLYFLVLGPKLLWVFSRAARACFSELGHAIALRAFEDQGFMTSSIDCVDFCLTFFYFEQSIQINPEKRQSHSKVLPTGYTVKF